MDGQQVRVLVVDDDALVRRAVRLTCESEGYTVQEAERAGEALARLEVFHPDIVVLDVVLPDLSGFDVCREIRRAGHRMPVIILSAKHDEIDVVLGLEIGADDYVAKPFSPRELLARLRAVLRRASPDALADRIKVGLVAIDAPSREVRLSGKLVDLTGVEFDILLALARRAGRVVPRESLLSDAGRNDVVVGERTVDVHISHLRQKLGDDPRTPKLIKTVRGVGYILAKDAP